MEAKVGAGSIELFKRYFVTIGCFPLDKTSCIVALAGCLSPFMIDNIKENMRYSYFRMIDLMNSDKPVSFYFHIPPHLMLQNDTIIKLFMERWRNYRQRLIIKIKLDIGIKC